MQNRDLNLIKPVELPIPELPAELEGLRIGHISDLHVRRPRRRHAEILRQLTLSHEQNPIDLLVFSGDITAGPGFELPTIKVVTTILETIEPRIGSFGCYGNHDTELFYQQVGDLPVNFLSDEAWADENRPLNILGIHCPYYQLFGDFPKMLLAEKYQPSKKRLRILLSHTPQYLISAGDVGIDLVLSGHTHGGQCRLPGCGGHGGLGPIYNGSGDWPLSLTSGVLRYRRTWSVISNGIGEQGTDGLRFFCPAHIPMITLTKSDKPIDPATEIEMVQRW